MKKKNRGSKETFLFFFSLAYRTANSSISHEVTSPRAVRRRFSPHSLGQNTLRCACRRPRRPGPPPRYRTACQAGHASSSSRACQAGHAQGHAVRTTLRGRRTPVAVRGRSRIAAAVGCAQVTWRGPAQRRPMCAACHRFRCRSRGPGPLVAWLPRSAMIISRAKRWVNEAAKITTFGRVGRSSALMRIHDTSVLK